MNLSSTRAVLRISWRNIRRNRWRSVLVGLLIMLPVTAMVGGITYFETVTPSAETVATWAMGAADAEAYTMPGVQASTDQLRSTLPAGSTVEEMSTADGVVVLPGRRVGVTVRSANLEGLARGMLDLIEGRLPSSSGGVAISRSLASLAGVGIGDSIQLEGSSRQTIVGLIEDPSGLSSRVVLEHPSNVDAADPAGRMWLVALPPGVPAESLDQLSGQDALFTANPRAGFYGGSGDITLGTLLVGALALIETVLVGAAAFAVSIRRRQRELGLLAAAGASRRQLAATVVGEGVLLAALAAGLAVLVGVGLVALASPWLDQITNHRTGPLVIDFVAVGLAALVGVVAGVAAALVPAWTAARVPPLLALSGRRPPVSSARRTLMAGLAAVGSSVVLTAAGASVLLGDPANGIAPMLLVGGAILGVFGFGACSPWLVERLEWLSRHLPLAGRIALRETARARSRTAPLITATLAGLAAAIAIATIVATQTALFGVEWQAWLRPDQFLLVGPQAVQRGPRVAEQMSAVGAAGTLMPVAGDGSDRSLTIVVTPGDGAAPANLDDSGGCSNCGPPPLFPGVGTPDFLAAMGAEAAATDLAEGHVVLLADQPLDARWATVAVQENSLVPQSGPDGAFYPTHYTQIQQLPARAFVVGAAAHGQFPTALISEQLAALLGFEAVPEQNMFVIRLDHQVTEADVAAAASLIADSPNTYVEADFKPIDPSAVERLIVSALSIVLALTITAIAVALGEAESRADQRTLVAVGADPGLRRRIVAARAGVIALLAAILALPAGLLPVWGLYASRNQAVALPLPELVAIIVVLPVVAMLGGLLLSRSLPPWSAFRDVSAA
jgi:putative ABC transport system permease protein